MRFNWSFKFFVLSVFFVCISLKNVIADVSKPIDGFTDMVYENGVTTLTDSLEQKYVNYGVGWKPYLESCSLGEVQKSLTYVYGDKKIVISPTFVLGGLSFDKWLSSLWVNWSFVVRDRSDGFGKVFDVAFDLPVLSGRDFEVVFLVEGSDPVKVLSDAVLGVGDQVLSFEDVVADCDERVVRGVVQEYDYDNCLVWAKNEEGIKVCGDYGLKNVSTRKVFDNCYSVDVRRVSDFAAEVVVSKEWSWYVAGSRIVIDPVLTDNSGTWSSGTHWRTQVKNTNVVLDYRLSGYNFSRNITVTEKSNVALTNYELKFTLNTAALVSVGKLQSDCDDLRFYSAGGVLLDYWIESGCNTVSTIIWVEVPSIPKLSSANIIMYYGNPSASYYSNGSNTFNFFDDFIGSSLSSSKWTSTTASSGTITVGGGIVNLTTANIKLSSAAMYSKQGFSVNTSLRTRAYVDHAASTYPTLASYYNSTDANDNWVWWYFDGGGAKDAYSKKVGSTTVTGLTLPVGQFAIWEISRYSGLNNSFWMNNSRMTTHTTNVITIPRSVSNYITCSSGAVCGIKRIKMDWVVVRDYVGKEPTYSVGYEQSYYMSGNYTSRVMDALASSNWQTISWSNFSETSGTIGLYVHDCDDDACVGEASWDQLCSVSPCDISGSVSSSRWFQYRAKFGTGNSSYTGRLHEVNVSYAGALSSCIWTGGSNWNIAENCTLTANKNVCPYALNISKRGSLNFSTYWVNASYYLIYPQYPMMFKYLFRGVAQLKRDC